MISSLPSTLLALTTCIHAYVYRLEAGGWCRHTYRCSHHHAWHGLLSQKNRPRHDSRGNADGRPTTADSVPVPTTPLPGTASGFFPAPAEQQPVAAGVVPASAPSFYSVSGVEVDMEADAKAGTPQSKQQGLLSSLQAEGGQMAERRGKLAPIAQAGSHD